jgi:hypothetical protein
MDKGSHRYGPWIVYDTPGRWCPHMLFVQRIEYLIKIEAITGIHATERGTQIHCVFYSIQSHPESGSVYEKIVGSLGSVHFIIEIDLEGLPIISTAGLVVVVFEE